MEDIEKTIIKNFSDSNVQQLVNYILSDEDDIVQCFNLEGELKVEIFMEFNRIETKEFDSTYKGDDEDAAITSSGYCSGVSSNIADYRDVDERMAFTYLIFCRGEENQSSAVSMCSPNASLNASKLPLLEGNLSFALWIIQSLYQSIYSGIV